MVLKPANSHEETNVSVPIRFRVLAACAILLAQGCNGTALTDLELAHYEMSGGIAGHATRIDIYQSLIAEVEIRGQRTTIRVQPEEMDTLDRLFSGLDGSQLSDAAPEPPCCDQITAYVSLRGRFVDLTRLDVATAEPFHALFRNMQARAKQSSDPAAEEQEAGDA